MTIPAQALRAAVLKALAEEVKAAVEDGKESLKDVMDEMEIDSLSAKLPDGTKVARVSRAGGGAKAKVTDPAKFLAWVQSEHPEEVVPSVRESYQKALLAAIDKAGQPADPSTGEVVPGVEFRESASYLTVSYVTGDTPGGQEMIRDAWRSGRISLTEMLALPAGDNADG